MNIVKLLILGIALGSQLFIGAVLAEGDSVYGDELFKKHCAACHNVLKGATPDIYGVVLPLHGVVDKESAQTTGFFYSEAMRKSGVVWTEENLDQYLADPKKMLPGIRMEFVGLQDEQERQDIIAYLLEQQGGSE